MSKHTPGPWRVDGGVSEYGAPAVYALEDVRGGKRNRMFATVYGGPDTPREETVANARLIALAPEMLEAIERLLWLIEIELKIDGQHITAGARSLLARAEGRE